jgi:hypothetical protein
VKHKYDLFEKSPDGLSLWRDSLLGFQLTRRRLKALAQISESQYYAINLTTGEVLAFISKRAMHKDPAHFQKLKDEARAMLLRYGGHGGGSLSEAQSVDSSPNWVN